DFPIAFFVALFGAGIRPVPKEREVHDPERPVAKGFDAEEPAAVAAEESLESRAAQDSLPPIELTPLRPAGLVDERDGGVGDALRERPQCVVKRDRLEVQE